VGGRTIDERSGRVIMPFNDVRTEKDMGKLLISVNYELLAATIGKNERTYSSP
jgi:hypothetical protein